MSHGKQITLYSHVYGPNGWKVAFFLEELGLQYATIFLDFKAAEQKGPEFTKLNPNGRIPCIVDHENSDYTLWESCAILEYLAYRYDKEGKVSVANPEEKYQQLQWLFFQASGQGPYFGQASWFKNYHTEKISSAIERYRKETIRILDVLDSVLSKQEWLVGNKYTIADLSFIPWHTFAVERILNESDYDCAKEHPAVDAWIKKMLARPAIKKVLADKEVVNKT